MYLCKRYYIVYNSQDKYFIYSNKQTSSELVIAIIYASINNILF